MTGLDRSLGRALAHARGAGGGAVTTVYPSLALADPGLLAGAVRLDGGIQAAAGDAGASFILMSAAKPFVLALAVDREGVSEVLGATGMRATGRAFNDVRAIHEGPGGRTNPMVNPGAITASALIARRDVAGAERRLLAGLSAFAGRDLSADPRMVDAIHRTNHRNRELAIALDGRGLLASDVETALHLYTVQSCAAVTVDELARMGAVLALGGRDPATGARIVSAEAAAIALDAMALAGLYEATEAWMARTRLPAKSGISGAMVAVAPGRGAAAAYSPPLDGAGNPVRAQELLASLAPALR